MNNDIKKKASLLVVLVILIAIVAGFFIFEDYGKTSAVFADKNYKIVVDAGHGKPDGGTIGAITGLKESDVNISVAEYLKAKLEDKGVTVVMTRTGKDAIADTKSGDMALRREIIEKSGQNITVSIHQNYFEDASVHGPQVFFAAGSEEGKKLAECIQNAMNEDLNSKAPREAMESDYFIVNSGTAPAVIVECGFLSNPEEEQLLVKKKYRMRIADSIIRGIEAYVEQNG